MILFCEECGTRHDVDTETIKGNTYQFSCSVCHETLVVSVSNKQGKSVQAALQQDSDAGLHQAEENLSILVVDDSKLIRKVLRQIIESDGRKRVIGEAEDGKQAVSLLDKLDPDVITLDINMPVMDGLTTLKHIMIKKPTPTVMISALTKEGALETFDSLKYGAIDFLPKPSQVKGNDISTQKEEILKKIELAAAVQIESVRYLRRTSKGKQDRAPNETLPRAIVGIGVAEGGYGALLNVIPNLRSDLPASFLAVMHQAPHHVDGFAHYLNQCSQLEVKRVAHDLPLQAGICYLAAADECVSLVRKTDHLRIHLKAKEDAKDSGPIDALMVSLADVMADMAAGVILTGAGTDGIDGLGRIVGSGGTAFVQDPASSLYKETPSTVADKYEVDFLVSDKQMAGAINSFLISKCK